VSILPPDAKAFPQLLCEQLYPKAQPGGD